MKNLSEFKGYCHKEPVIKTHNSNLYNDEKCRQLNFNLIHFGYNDEKELSLNIVQNINHLGNYSQGHPVEEFNFKWLFPFVRENHNIKEHSNTMNAIDISIKKRTLATTPTT